MAEQKPTVERQRGNYFEYTFTGTGVEVYSQKHANFASFDIFIDNENMGKYSLEGSGSGDNQQLVFSKTDLANDEHTIKCAAAERDGKYQVNLDYLKIFSPGEGVAVDKAELRHQLRQEQHLLNQNMMRQTGMHLWRHIMLRLR